jgi:hypothetical protein
VAGNFPFHHVDHLFRDVGGMVSDPFKMTRNEEEIDEIPDPIGLRLDNYEQNDGRGKKGIVMVCVHPFHEKISQTVLASSVRLIFKKVSIIATSSVYC